MMRKNGSGLLMKQICAMPNLTAAWRVVRGNIAVSRRAHSCGVDEVSVAAFEQQWEENLIELGHSLLEGRYQPLPPRIVEVRKRGGQKRSIGLLAVRDRIAQRAMHQVLAPLFEAQFLDCSYGFRTGRSVEDAVHRVLCYRQAGCNWVFDADIANCFDTLDHKLLMRFVSEAVRERPVLDLIDAWLEVGLLETDAEVYRMPDVWSRLLDRMKGKLLLPSSEPVRHWADGEDRDMESLTWNQGADWGWRRQELLKHLGTDVLLAGLAAARPLAEKTLPGLRRLVRRKGVIWGAAGLTGAGALAVTWMILQRLAPRPRGTLQGGSISPLLANVYLHHFDRAMTEAGQNLVRFADDFVICCPEQGTAERAGELAARELADLRLRLNPAKTHVISFDRGFNFLGHRFGNRQRALPRPRRNGKK